MADFEPEHLLDVEGDPEKCQLLGDFGIVVQLILGGLSLSSLFSKRFQFQLTLFLVKWWFEKPQRPRVIFYLDMSKQVISALSTHFVNMLLSMIVRQLTRQGDDCLWYFVNMSLDCTIGLLLIFLLFRTLSAFAERNKLDVRTETALTPR